MTVDLEAGTNLIVYAVGSLDDDSFTFLTQEIEVGTEAPAEGEGVEHDLGDPLPAGLGLPLVPAVGPEGHDAGTDQPGRHEVERGDHHELGLARRAVSEARPIAKLRSKSQK